MRTICAALLLLAYGCASAKQGPYYPPRFEIAAVEAGAAWTRAQLWVAEHRDELGITPLLTLTETELKTAPPSGKAKIYVFVTRERRENGSWRFEVLADNANPAYTATAAKVEVLLARYIATGE
jgi:hypothetical protein